MNKNIKLDVTKTIIIICVLFQLFTYLKGYTTNDIYYLFGINQLMVFENSQYYRIITGSFIHADLIHLSMNMLSLYYLSNALKYYIDDITLLVIYIASLLSSAFASTLFGSVLSVSVGASGAIYGLFGAIIVIALLKKNHDNGKMIGAIIPVVILNLGISLMPGINMIAHLSGLVSGGFIYYVYANRNIKAKEVYYCIIPVVLLLLNLI